MKTLKTILKLFFLFVIIAGIVFAIILSQKQICSEINVSINYQGENYTVTKSQIYKEIIGLGIIPDSIRVKDVDMSLIANLLSQNDFIQKIEYIGFVGSKLNVEITLYDLLLHVFPQQGGDFFVSTDGTVLPPSSCVKERLIIANGCISTKYEKISTSKSIDSTLIDLFDVARHIVADTFYKAQFTQLYVDEQKNITLISSVGSQSFILGNAEGINEKFMEIKEVYKKGGIVNENNISYTSFDLRFKNRIIAKI